MVLLRRFSAFTAPNWLAWSGVWAGGGGAAAACTHPPIILKMACAPQWPPVILSILRLAPRPPKKLKIFPTPVLNDRQVNSINIIIIKRREKKNDYFWTPVLLLLLLFQISIILSIVQGVKLSDGLYFMLGLCLIGFVAIEIILVRVLYEGCSKYQDLFYISKTHMSRDMTKPTK